LTTYRRPRNPSAFNTLFVVGQSATRQISHTKGFVADGKAGGEGSTKWSVSGEGTFVVTGKPGGAGYKLQNSGAKALGLTLAPTRVPVTALLTQ
jgi:hypothetical protein